MPKLHTQQFLQSHTLDDLEAELGIKATLHETDPLIILNYNQINSPKLHPVVRECRALVLHAETHELVAKSFDRFFNWGEVVEEMDDFDFSNFIVEDKEDGSLILLYHFDGRWRVNTRRSFASQEIHWHKLTWEQAVCQALGLNDLTELGRHLDPSLTYVGEFCSHWNKVVRRYDEPTVYLLTAFVGHRELSWKELDEHCATNTIMRRPNRHEFHSIEEIQEFLSLQETDDPTYEGVVIRDANNRRWKIKNAAYLGLHRLRGEGDNLWNPKHLVPFILAGEEDELLTYFPEVIEFFQETKATIEQHYTELFSVWEHSHQIENQKEFALAIKDATPFSGVLFQLRKNLGQNQTSEDLRKAWLGSDSLIMKVIFSR